MAQPRLDPYATLGLRPGATPAQVREAYRRLAKRHHPALHPDPTATDRMRRVNEARGLLSGAGTRAPSESTRTRAANPPRDWQGTRAGPSPAPAVAASGLSPVLVIGLAVLLLPVLIAVGLIATIAAGFLPLPLFGLVLLAAVRLGAALSRGDR